MVVDEVWRSWERVGSAGAIMVEDIIVIVLPREMRMAMRYLRGRG